MTNINSNSPVVFNQIKNGAGSYNSARLHTSEAAEFAGLVQEELTKLVQSSDVNGAAILAQAAVEKIATDVSAQAAGFYAEKFNQVLPGWAQVPVPGAAEVGMR
jgi:hypothetical protein